MIDFILPENEALAKRIHREVLSDPDSPYAGKQVGIADGRVVVVANSVPEVEAELRRVQPNAEHWHFVDATLGYEPLDADAANAVAVVNDRLATAINQEARSDPASPYAGKLVGIADGRVVVVADDWEKVVEELNRVQPDPVRCMCLDASADYEQVVHIWSLGE